VRRTKLIWLASGLAISSAIWIAGGQFFAQKQSTAVIAIHDRDFIEPQKMVGMTSEEIGVNLSSAGLARRCGATSFETNWKGSSHSVPETRVVIQPTNVKAIDCIVARAPKEGFPVNFLFENR
jgi:hypothetical protein